MSRWLFILLLCFSLPALAVEPDEMLKDPALEMRARAISKELRCLVCQGQPIDDSNAPLAHDLRVLVRQRLKAGDTDAQVREYLKERYGDFILLKPPVEGKTAILWLAPLLVLGAGLLIAFRKRSGQG
jgi:cytochrome c-type biogenesis protein CcmH